jgi:hypothetical protein
VEGWRWRLTVPHHPVSGTTENPSEPWFTGHRLPVDADGTVCLRTVGATRRSTMPDAVRITEDNDFFQ